MFIEQPGISPAARTDACSICGGNVQGVPALSTGVDVLYEGIIEICQRCIVEGAAIYGMVTPEKYAELEAQFSELQEWADNAYSELQAKEDMALTLSAALGRVVAERDALQANADSLALSHRVGA